MTDRARSDTTLVTCLTPPGAGAIATLALRGRLAWTIARRVFRIGRESGAELPTQAVPYKHWLGRLGEEPGSVVADDVVLVVKRADPAPWVELHCHGGKEVVQYFLELLTAHGAEACSWPELERATAEISWKAHAENALVHAPTLRTAAILLDQHEGIFAGEIEGVRAAIVVGDLPAARKRLAALVKHVPVGRHLVSPWRVVVAGPPNVGKSSLVNALAGYQRSIVSATPGTTRDVVTTSIAIEGWPVELADTAGQRPQAAALEQMGIEWARSAAETADLCLWVLDSTMPATVAPPELKSARYVVNKIDLPADEGFVAPAGAVRVSARLGEGIGDLCVAIARWLVADPPRAGVAVPYTPWLCDCVEEADRLCECGLDSEALCVLDEVMSWPAY